MTHSSTDQAVAEAVEGSANATTSLRESLSALVDSEASELELRRLLQSSESDPDIQERWKRYHLIRAVLQGDLTTDPKVDLSSRISAAIAQEAPLQLSSSSTLQVPSRLKQWRDNLGKAAIAASVAFVFVVGVQEFSAPGEQAPAQVANTAEPIGEPVSVAGGAPSGFELPPFAARTVSAGPGVSTSGASAFGGANHQADQQLQHNQALQNYFNHLLLKHAERSSTNGSMGLLPFARVSRMDAAQE